MLTNVRARHLYGGGNYVARKSTRGHMAGFRSNAAEVGRWREVANDPAAERRMIDADNSYLRTYSLGGCSVLVTKEFGEWHMNIAHPSRYPTWDEVATARYNAIPDGVTMAMLLPPKDEYVNIHSFCLQAVEIRR